MGSGEIRWVPLESNPEVMTKYSRSLGASVGQWVDVFALDEDSLAAVPQPVKAVILLFPISEGYDQYCKEQDEALKLKGQEVPQDLFYMKQFIHNACGTVGMIHSLGNNFEDLKLDSESILKKFLENTKDMDAHARGLELEKFNQIATVHEEIASEGQTAAPSRDDTLVTHFVAFVHKDGHLYELDGRREFPINHGATTAEDLLKDAAAVCKSRIERDPTEYRFTIVALTTGDVE
ncbi:ubiquitin carboxyl-terminal hydrolase isozyme L3 [Folsomia candida]|uniref:ubiquitin carboxyl-terminal hydrolase isozyme L3 n=1 Tax=Folsomia candida TaxID=158441 RepID=UPI000B8F84D5|nr:ubiquitin carboxyl-terminal hydrolase isozyme L3 [Folsomia candida]